MGYHRLFAECERFADIFTLLFVNYYGLGAISPRRDAAPLKAASLVLSGPGTHSELGVLMSPRTWVLSTVWLWTNLLTFLGYVYSSGTLYPVAASPTLSVTLR